MASYDALIWIPLLPLIGAALLGAFGSKMDRALVGLVGIGTVFGAFCITLIATATYLDRGAPLEHVIGTWFSVGRYRFDATLGLDALSATLLLVVTGVGLLIHIYSVGYMHEDPGYWRYFAYLNLFIFAMSTLVLGRSLPIMFVGWEGVGLASYLLIGFWYTDEEKAAAGKKAFIVNRIGDFGFLLGMFTLVGLFGTLDFAELRQTVQEAAGSKAATAEILASGMYSGASVQGVITFACLCLFLGATGKSAQFPLFIWLPDAMAGPTPVSALIHAATMVTAGVYMIARLHFLFDLAPQAQQIIVAVGIFTALMAATIGLVQNDIKRVLAYSTVSQLGLMFVAAGLGAYGTAMFHLVTHAFFKACLFLGAGAVIHALHGEQDLRKMGGLKNKLPAVYWTMLISTLAIAGFPLTSGFFSKDAILAFAYERSPLLFGFGIFGAALTAIYMARLMALAFHGPSRATAQEGELPVHAPGASMVFPLWKLAFLALFAGILNLPPIAPGARLFLEKFLRPVFGEVRAPLLSHATEWALLAGSSVVAIAGLWIGFALFRAGPSKLATRVVQAGPGRVVHGIFVRKWYWDDLYTAFANSLKALSALLASVLDPFVIDGVLVKATGRVCVGTGRAIRRLQTGNVQAYAAVFVLAVAALVLWMST